VAKKSLSTGLLELLAGRERAIMAMPLPYRVPECKDPCKAQIETVASLYAEVHNTDPFAKARAMLHMTRGLELPSDVSKEARAALTARNNAKSFASPQTGN
jgi:hypothetical protein